MDSHRALVRCVLFRGSESIAVTVVFLLIREHMMEPLGLFAEPEMTLNFEAESVRRNSQTVIPFLPLLSRKGNLLLCWTLVWQRFTADSCTAVMETTPPVRTMMKVSLFKRSP